MAFDLLTSSGIKTLVENFSLSETQKRITPLSLRKTKYQDKDKAYTQLHDKLSAFKTLLSTLKTTGNFSAFADKTASSSNSDFVTITPSSSAIANTSSIRITQLAKNDLALSKDLNSSDASTTITEAGTHTFTLTGGDGTDGVVTSHVSVTFEETDFTNGAISNKKVMEKIQKAINDNRATVISNSVTGSTVSAGSFVANINGKDTTIDYSAGTYSSVIDSVVTELNKISGINAQKIVDGSNYTLNITVTDTSKYISISDDTSNLVSELGIATTKEIGASGIVSTAVFSPQNLTSQLSFTAKQSGYGYRLLSMTDTNSGNALNSIGLNLGATRQVFVQNEGVDTPGYVYSTSVLNAKIEFNGINIERNSNTINDLLTGVSINLKSTMQPTDTTVSLAVSNDTSKVKDKIQNFIDKFNDVYLYLKNQSIYDGNLKGTLFLDSTATTILNFLRSSATSAVSGIASDKLNSLTKLGITFDNKNGLAISDSTQLENSIKDKADQVEAIFNSVNGIATNLYARVYSYLGAGGYIAKSRNSFGSSIKNLQSNIDSQQKVIDKRSALLRDNYIKMQQQLSSLMNNQSLFSSSGFGG